jgi:hypothetical protein
MYILENDGSWVFTPGPPGQGTLLVSTAETLERFAEIVNTANNVSLYSGGEYKRNITVQPAGAGTLITFSEDTSTFDPTDTLRVIMHSYKSTSTGGPTSAVEVTNWPSIQSVQGSVAIQNEVEIKNDINDPIIVSGDLNVVNEVEIKNDAGNPISVTGTVAIDSNQVLPVFVQYPPGSTGGFGENLVAEITPIGQYDAIYGIGGDLASDYETFDAFGGFAGTEDGMFAARSSTTIYSYGVLRSNRFLRYRPGQSATGRFTAMFTQGKAGTEQRAGLFNQESAFMVGYNGTNFGILHSYGATVAIATLQVTFGPSTSSDCTIVLNGITHTVPLVAGESTAETAARIAASTFNGWNAQQSNSTVVFVSLDTNPKAGAFSFSHVDATGSITLTRQGVPPTDVWIPQTSWNIDTMNELGPSGANLVPTNLNVFQIRYKWLGAGSISFMIEDPNTGKSIEFHKIIWTNQNTQPHIANPSLKIGFVAYNLVGGATSQVEVKGASMMIGVDGKREVNRLPRSVSVYKSGLSNDNNDPDDIHHIVSILNPLVINDKINTRELILNTASLSAIASSPTIFKVLFDVQLSNELLTAPVIPVYSSLPETNALVSTTEGYIDGSQYTALTSSALVGGGQAGGQKDLDLNQYNIVIPAGSSITIGAVSSSNITQLSAAITWTMD